ncbi:DsbA family protein [Parvularcula sp. IMCC14364]|uniref:DsbA family oxidoreductase n=1 Tax=Parvularcula sp. IMCC14364 TaxID=3067902 RepID=UPI002740F105|nr:DsbA family oxidoreductase [Parvularcula sp. IMCC14364]
MSDAKPRLVIDMVADPVCPWCYVGKRSLDRVLMAMSFSHEVVVRYRPYQLAPDTPEEGVDRKAYIEKKFPDSAHRSALADALRDAATGAGLDLNIAGPTKLINSLNALRVLRWSHLDGVQIEFVEALFSAYWQQGRDISQTDELSRIAAASGMDGADVRARLETDEDCNDVRDEVAAFRSGGVDGVPTFIINESLGFAGALPPDQLLENIRSIATETGQA